MDNEDPEKLVVAQQAWRRMFGFLMHTRPHRDAVLARLRLTPNDAKALQSLDADRGRSMTELAAAWGCDASTATWTVNRLERLGMAERRHHPHDRRYRLVVLTPAGVTTKTEVLKSMNATPPELLQLDEAELRALRDLLAKLPNGFDDTSGAGPNM